MVRRQRHIVPNWIAAVLALVVCAVAQLSVPAHGADVVDRSGDRTQIQLDFDVDAHAALREVTRPVPNVTQREIREDDGITPAAPDERSAKVRHQFRMVASLAFVLPSHPPLYCLHDVYLI